MRIAHAHNTRLPKDAKLPIKWFCKQFIPGAATDYWACGREAGIYYFGQSAWDARGVTLRNAIDLDRFGYRPEVRAKLRAEYGLNDKLVVGCVARLMAQKNHTRLLDIFAALKRCGRTAACCWWARASCGPSWKPKPPGWALRRM